MLSNLQNMLYLSKYHCEVNSNRLIPVSIHFGMFVISRGKFFLFKYPALVIYFVKFSKNSKKSIFFVIVSAPRQC